MFSIVIAFMIMILKGTFKKNTFSYDFKKFLVKIVVRLIFTCKINEKHVFIY